MDLTGSIAEATAPLSTEFASSLEGGLTGSSAIDTIAQALFILPNLLLAFVGGLGGDLGSTGSAGFPTV
ncbi:hypothetical protein [Dietzia psychralcaliphila]|uniref:hypothetical protein n=1 Tax=Dietzia psychralcaliphila TaxID=139021 RepID=UPI001C1E5849|nr:hypothetical protein [Dietzia psychralcaliphila]